MGTNLALKRARKAQRRKHVVAEKRKAEAFEGSLSAQVLRAAQAPIQMCLATESLFEIGMGQVVLGRGATPHELSLGVFLVDVWCLGVKDAMFRIIDDDTLDLYLSTLETEAPFAEVDPRYARKLLRDLAAWSQSIGFSPHPDFAVVERLFGDVDADAIDTVFQFGRNGKPVYIPGPNDSAQVIQRRLRLLRERFGDDLVDSAA